MTIHLCGAGLAFLGFGLSLIIGLWVDNPFITVVSRSLVVLVVFYVLGYLLALIGQKVIVSNFEREKLAALAQIASSDQDEETDLPDDGIPQAEPTPPLEPAEVS